MKVQPLRKAEKSRHLTISLPQSQYERSRRLRDAFALRKMDFGITLTKAIIDAMDELEPQVRDPALTNGKQEDRTL